MNYQNVFLQDQCSRKERHGERIFQHNTVQATAVQGDVETWGRLLSLVKAWEKIFCRSMKWTGASHLYSWSWKFTLQLSLIFYWYQLSILSPSRMLTLIIGGSVWYWQIWQMRKLRLSDSNDLLNSVGPGLESKIFDNKFRSLCQNRLWAKHLFAFNYLFRNACSTFYNLKVILLNYKEGSISFCNISQGKCYTDSRTFPWLNNE